jgi:hypothetical protein
MTEFVYEKKIKLKADNQHKFSHSVITYYTTDFRRITLKHLERHRKLNDNVSIIYNGIQYKDISVLDKLDYDTFKEVIIFRNNHHPSQVLLLIITDDK